MDYFAGLDLGTTHIKATALDTQGKIRAATFTATPVRADPDGAHTIDPTALLEQAAGVLRQLMEQMRHVPPRAIGISAAMHALLPLDAHDQPLMPILTWADRRAAELGRRLRQSEEGRQLHRDTGTPVHAMSPVVKAAWLARTHPHLYARIGRLADLTSWTLLNWTGRHATSQGMASAWGMWSLTQAQWHPPALEQAQATLTWLPEVLPARAIAGSVSRHAQSRWGLPAGLPLVAGSADGCLAQLAASALGPETGVLTIGTSAAFRRTIDRPEVAVDDGLFCYVLDEKHFVAGGASNNGGIAWQWLETLFGESQKDTLLQQAMATPPGAEGLYCLPTLLGERAPWWDEWARAAFVGLTNGHTQAHLRRALWEGVMANVACIAGATCARWGKPEMVVATGGFRQNEALLQLAADMLDVPVATSGRDAGAAAALLAAEALGHRLPWPPPRPVIFPDEEKVAFYTRFLARWRGLYAALRPWFHTKE